MNVAQLIEALSHPAVDKTLDVLFYDGDDLVEVHAFQVLDFARGIELMDYTPLTPAQQEELREQNRLQKIADAAAREAEDFAGQEF